MPELLTGTARFINRWAVWVIAVWVATAGLANALVPQLERVAAAQSSAFIPNDAESSQAVARSAELFGEPISDNLNYVVLEREQPLQPQDRRFYDDLVAALLTDTEHVSAVSDLWSEPLTEPLALSSDRRAVTVMVQLSGVLGTAEASEAVAAVRQAVTRLNPPAGLDVYVTGPGSTLVDEFAAIDHQMLTITAATVGVIMLLLLLVYRSTLAAAIPLISVGMALAVARPVVAVLGEHRLTEVSLFTVALIAAMVLGAGTDYAIFLLGRYHEGRRHGVEPVSALANAYRGVAPVVIGSALTVTAALSCLGFARLSMYRSIGIPCALGISTGMIAALTLTPALMALAIHRGLLEPRRAGLAGRWRRIGVLVARWPGPILALSGSMIGLLALPTAGLRTGWGEASTVPSGTESSRGYTETDRHFPTNQLFPAVLTIQSDHDLRDPAGLIAIERISRQIMAIPGVRSVQSATRPAAKILDEATLAHHGAVVGDQLRDAGDALIQRLAKVGKLDTVLSQLGAAVDALAQEIDTSTDGLGEFGSAAHEMTAGMDSLQDTVTTMSGYLDPLRRFIDDSPDCATSPVCSTLVQVVEPVDSVIRSSTQLSSGTAKFNDGSSKATAGLAEMSTILASMRDAIRQAHDATRELTAVVDGVSPQLRQIVDYLQEGAVDFHNSATGGFYLPARALADPRYQQVLRALVSLDGRSTRLLVFGRGTEWGIDGVQRATSIREAVTEATKEGTLNPVSIQITGVGPATRDLQVFVHRDTVLLVATTLALIFGIVTVMLRSPVASLAVVGTVVISYASALGIAVLFWQYLLGHPLHWAVAPMAFIALVAVGADYNLLLAMRIREEARAGIGTGLVRAFAGTGGVVTTAGIIFGITMLALMSSTLLSVAQIGFTVGVGLMLDTLIVRTLLLPSLVTLLGRWFWWPAWTVLPTARTVRARLSKTVVLEAEPPARATIHR